MTHQQWLNLRYHIFWRCVIDAEGESMNAFAEFVHELLLDPNEHTALSDEFFDDDHSEDPEPEPHYDPQTGFMVYADDYDPTPWCDYCGARKKSDCHCGPLAEND